MRTRCPLAAGVGLASLLLCVGMALLHMSLELSLPRSAGSRFALLALPAGSGAAPAPIHAAATSAESGFHDLLVLAGLYRVSPSVRNLRPYCSFSWSPLPISVSYLGWFRDQAFIHDTVLVLEFQLQVPYTRTAPRRPQQDMGNPRNCVSFDNCYFQVVDPVESRQCGGLGPDCIVVESQPVRHPNFDYPRITLQLNHQIIYHGRTRTQTHTHTQTQSQTRTHLPDSRSRSRSSGVSGSGSLSGVVPDPVSCPALGGFAFDASQGWLSRDPCPQCDVSRFSYAWLDMYNTSKPRVEDDENGALIDTYTVQVRVSDPGAYHLFFYINWHAIYNSTHILYVHARDPQADMESTPDPGSASASAGSGSASGSGSDSDSSSPSPSSSSSPSLSGGQHVGGNLISYSGVFAVYPSLVGRLPVSVSDGALVGYDSRALHSRLPWCTCADHAGRWIQHRSQAQWEAHTDSERVTNLHNQTWQGFDQIHHHLYPLHGGWFWAPYDCKMRTFAGSAGVFSLYSVLSRFGSSWLYRGSSNTRRSAALLVAWLRERVIRTWEWETGCKETREFYKDRSGSGHFVGESIPYTYYDQHAHYHNETATLYWTWQDYLLNHDKHTILNTLQQAFGTHQHTAKLVILQFGTWETYRVNADPFYESHPEFGLSWVSSMHVVGGWLRSTFISRGIPVVFRSLQWNPGWRPCSDQPCNLVADSLHQHATAIMARYGAYVWDTTTPAKHLVLDTRFHHFQCHHSHLDVVHHEHLQLFQLLYSLANNHPTTCRFTPNHTHTEE